MATRLELVGLYFDYIHDQFHSLFHRPTFMQQADRNEVEEILLLAIFSLSARYSRHPLFTDLEPRLRGEGFRTACEALLNIRDISLVTVQVCTLLGAYAAGQGEIEVENLYYTLAGRMVGTMRLHEQPAASPLEAETRIRGSSHPADRTNRAFKRQRFLYANAGPSGWFSMVESLHDRCVVVNRCQIAAGHATNIPARNSYAHG